MIEKRVINIEYQQFLAFSGWIYLCYIIRFHTLFHFAQVGLNAKKYMEREINEYKKFNNAKSIERIKHSKAAPSGSDPRSTRHVPMSKRIMCCIIYFAHNKDMSKYVLSKCHLPVVAIATHPEQ